MKKGTAATSTAEPETLAEAHTAVWQVWPRTGAGLTQWRDFRAHAARVYARVAEVDLRHRNEALAWAAAERDEVAVLTRRIKSESKQDKGNQEEESLS